MSEVLSRGGIALLKREKASLVAATGLIFERLKETSPDISLQDSLLSYKGGTWGDESVEGVGYPVLRSSNMRGKRVDVSEAAWCKIPEKQAEAFSLESGDILVTKSSGSFDLVGKAALFDDPNDGNLYLFSNFTMRLRPDRKKLIPEYLAWFLRSPQALSWRFENQQTTVGLRNLQTKEYLSQVIPIPSLEVQKHVIDYLNAVETESKESTTVKLPETLEKQRRTVERVQALAVRIAKAQSLREEASREEDVLIYSAMRQIFDPQKIQKHVDLEATCVAIIDNLHSNPDYSGDCVVPCIRSSDVGWGELFLHTARKTSEKEYQRRTVRGEPSENDIVLVREGGGTGKAALVGKNQRFSLGQRVMMLRPNPEIVLPKFLLFQLMSPHIFEEQILPRAKGSASPHLNIGSLRKFKFLLPPLGEQRRIVAYLDNVQARLVSLRELQSATREELSALLPSVLDRAFKGEL